jgi:hypothetical protein
LAGKQKPVMLVLDQRPGTTGIRNQHGNATGHRLENREPERLLGAGVQQEVEVRKPLGASGW